MRTTLGLETLLERKPKALSGGQRQRVALGRAIVRSPSVFLFDEPLSNLDAELRVQMRSEISKLQRRFNTTTVYVTHDQVEAMTMGHRIAVMRACEGLQTSNLMQCGTPMDLYEEPANVFTARFIGTPRMNILPARFSDDGNEVLVFNARMPVGAAFKQSAQRMRGQAVVLGIRPEHIGINHQTDWPQAIEIQGVVEMIEPLGHESIVHLKVNDQVITGRLQSHRALPSPGNPFVMQMNPDAMHLFDPVSEQRLA